VVTIWIGIVIHRCWPRLQEWNIPPAITGGLLFGLFLGSVPYLGGFGTAAAWAAAPPAEGLNGTLEDGVASATLGLAGGRSGRRPRRDEADHGKPGAGAESLPGHYLGGCAVLRHRQCRPDQHRLLAAEVAVPDMNGMLNLTLAGVP